jgi:GNAT superfamily N-acetyltransferase
MSDVQVIDCPDHRRGTVRRRSENGLVNSPGVFRAAATHAEVVARLLFDFNTEFDSPGPGIELLAVRFARLLERDDVIVLLTGSDQNPTGFAFLTLRPTPYYDGPLGQLEELYVRPELRDQGRGTALLQTAIRLVREHDGGEIHINVDEVDADTRRFYERHGFVNIEPGADYRMLCYLREL